jgi:hypothetical protein
MIVRTSEASKYRIRMHRELGILHEESNKGSVSLRINTHALICKSLHLEVKHTNGVALGKNKNGSFN